MIHEKIQVLRKQRKLRDEDMAERLGISQSTYSRLEKGEIKLDVERLRKIAEVLEVPVEDLLSNDSIVFHVETISGGANGCQRVEQHFPEEFMRQMMAVHEAHLKELQEMNKRLLALLERGHG